ncbi:MAG: elongation factor P maturation arginine rhamnosyltransferase EarP [Burkholderiales bacterium]
MLRHWDIFCRVIDNYGDIGVAWRLARQLAAEHGVAVRLWVDDLEPLEALEPRIDPAVARQSLAGVEVRRDVRDGNAGSAAQPGDVVVEAFGCEPPQDFIASMAARAADRAPVWVNLEYLSAEDWVHGCHGLPSIEPKTGLKRHFFFPGFTASTGGLLRERGLLAERDAFQASTAMQADLWRRLGIPPGPPHEWRVSLFCYARAPVEALLTGLTAHPHPARLIVPRGPAALAAAEWFGVPAEPGSQARLGNLALSVVPFMEQAEYDRLLWACDLNFVRGEDSFVRAQWAGRPLVWHIYPQAERAHEAKLDSFLWRYCHGLHEPRRDAVARFMQAWNSGITGINDFPERWRLFAANQSALRLHAEAWAWHLAESPDLASQLFEFAGKVASDLL